MPIADWLEKRCTEAEIRAVDAAELEDAERKYGARLAETIWPPVWPKLAEHVRPGDELWTFSSPLVSWEERRGRAGYAVVRDGKVVFSVLTVMN